MDKRERAILNEFEAKVRAMTSEDLIAAFSQQLDHHYRGYDWEYEVIYDELLRRLDATTAAKLK